MSEKVKITGTSRGYGVNADVDLTVELSLRDLFAAFALAAVIGLDLDESSHESDAAYAYHAADAMLAARQEKE